jgi:hypothetical protein
MQNFRPASFTVRQRAHVRSAAPTLAAYPTFAAIAR